VRTIAKFSEVRGECCSNRSFNITDNIAEYTSLFAHDLTEGDMSAPVGAKTFLDMSPSRLQPVSGAETQFETQYTALSSEASSLALLPSFAFRLASISSLSALRTPRPPPKLTVLVAVLEIDGPDIVKIKRGVDEGKELAVLKLILGDDDKIVARCTAWRDVAETWADGLKRGDVVCLSSALPSPHPLYSVINVPSYRCAIFLGLHKPPYSYRFAQPPIAGRDLLPHNATRVMR
jgi:hypothetical protein